MALLKIPASRRLYETLAGFKTTHEHLHSRTPLGKAFAYVQAHDGCTTSCEQHFHGPLCSAQSTAPFFPLPRSSEEGSRCTEFPLWQTIKSGYRIVAERKLYEGKLGVLKRDMSEVNEGCMKTSDAFDSNEKTMAILATVAIDN